MTASSGPIRLEEVVDTKAQQMSIIKLASSASSVKSVNAAKLIVKDHEINLG